MQDSPLGALIYLDFLYRCIEQPQRYSFKMSNVPLQHQQKLEVGSEVLFNVMTDGRGNDNVISLAILPAGSLQERQTSPSKPCHSSLYVNRELGEKMS